MIYFFNEKVTLLGNASVIPSMQRKKYECNSSPTWKFVWNELILRAWPWRMWNLVYLLKCQSPIHFWTEHIGLTISEVWLFELSPHAICNTMHPVLQYFHVYSLSIQSVFIVNLIIKLSEYIILNYSTFENGPNTKFKY